MAEGCHSIPSCFALTHMGTGLAASIAWKMAAYLWNYSWKDDMFLKEICSCCFFSTGITHVTIAAVWFSSHTAAIKVFLGTNRTRFILLPDSKYFLVLFNCHINNTERISKGFVFQVSITFLFVLEHIAKTITTIFYKHIKCGIFCYAQAVERLINFTSQLLQRLCYGIFEAPSSSPNMWYKELWQSSSKVRHQVDWSR